MSILNNSLLLGADAGGYQISRSLRFNSADSAFLSRTPASAGNRRTWTLSLWVKRAAIGVQQALFFAGVNTSGNGVGYLYFLSDNTLVFNGGVNGVSTDYQLQTTQVFRDTNAWMHVLAVFDTTNATSTDRCRLFINGTRVTQFSSPIYPSQNFQGATNNNVAHYLGSIETASYLSGYLADVHLIDGQALDPSSFVETSATTGQLIPKQYTGSFGTNGFWLKFSDNSAATATTLGKDYSGNNNNWTPNNLSVTAGAGNDSLVDTPTSYGTGNSGGDVRGSYCTWNPLDNSNTINNGNLDITPANNGWTRGTFWLATGKWYWECTIQTGSSAHHLGLNAGRSGDDSYRIVWRADGLFVKNSTVLSSIASYTTGDVLGFSFDADILEVKLYKNNTLQSTQTLTAPPSGSAYSPHYLGGGTTGLASANFGQRPFAFPVSGFKALCDTNLPAPTIARPSTVMDVKLYTGNGTTNNITGLGFSPDLVWIKSRSDAFGHRLFDTVRPLNGALYTNSADAERTVTTNDNFTAFNSGGFSLGATSSTNGSNASGSTFAAWAWDAGSSTVTNTSGSISSQVRANASAGVSIVTYSQGPNNSTVGHGLGVAPHMIIAKSRTSASGRWDVYHRALGREGYIYLDGTQAAGIYPDYWGTSGITSTTFGLSLSGNFNNLGNMVAYCFAPVAGYSAFGSYTGNGSTTDNTFVYTGMRPRFVMLKRSDSTGNWVVWDAARNSYNVANSILLPNTSAAEYSPDAKIDILSNGFKVRDNSSDSGTNGAIYIYAAFAENPFQYARAR